MRKLSHYLLLGIVLMSQAYWATAAIGGEPGSVTTAACEHLAAADSQSGNSHQLCNDHDCHATAHYLAVISAFTLSAPPMAHSQLRTDLNHLLSYLTPPPTQPPRSPV